MMNNDHTCSIGLVVEMILENVDRLVDENQPTVSFENSGIGHYEFWGAEGFDAGEDYPIAEDYLDTITIELFDFSNRLITHMAKVVDQYGYGSFTDVSVIGKNVDETVRCSYKIESAIKARGEKSITINLGWDDDLEVQ